MTPENAKVLLPLIKAFSEGKQIQIKSSGTEESGWVDFAHPAFNSSPECYRIKPEKHVTYVNVFPGGLIGCGFPTSEQATRQATYASNRIACIRIEYEEGQYDD